MNVTYKPIQADYQQVTVRQNVDLIAALDVMAEMEKAVLGFLDPKYGLAYDYGASNLPEVLTGRYPSVLHMPGPRAKLRSLTSMGGGSLVAHPGGTRLHSFPFTIHWVVGERGVHIERLQSSNLFWAKAVDMAYAANGSLGGQVKEVGLTSAQWGMIEYAGTDKAYFGWVFDGTLTLQYIMNGGG